MVVSYEDQLIENRMALMFKLLQDNQRHFGTWRILCAQREFINQYLDDEMCRLECDESNEISPTAVPVMEYLKELVNMSFSEVKLCIDCYNSDETWLNENISKCDVFHTRFWHLLMSRTLYYHIHIGNLFSRYMEVHAMFLNIVELLQTLTAND